MLEVLHSPSILDHWVEVIENQEIETSVIACVGNLPLFDPIEVGSALQHETQAAHWNAPVRLDAKLSHK